VKTEEREYTTAEQKERIDAAMDFLKLHIFDSDLKISSLHTLCGMSAPTFRRIFISKFGVTPKKYVTNQRLLQAKTILECGEYKSIAEVARLVGYDDPLYFSKHFKEFYGTSPSNF
jgi:AraC-like DNA-binding protein